MTKNYESSKNQKRIESLNYAGFYRKNLLVLEPHFPSSMSFSTWVSLNKKFRKTPPGELDIDSIIEKRKEYLERR